MNENKLKLINEELETENDLLRNKIKELDYYRSENKRLSAELDKIIYSRSYKIMQKIRKIFRRK